MLTIIPESIITTITKKSHIRVILFSGILLILLSPVLSFARELTSIELIANAYRNGEINYTDALNYRVAAVLNQEGLPYAYRSKVPIKSATMILLEARSNRHLLSPENARLLAKGRVQTLTDLYGSGVTLLSYMSPGRHFRIHYTVDNVQGDAVPATDNNGNSIPDYVEKFADILDHVYDTEINELGYDAAPSDDSEGGDCLLDVYLADLENDPIFGSAYGFTQIDLNDPTSYVYLIFDNDYSNFPANLNPGGQQEGDMKVTAAHEFFHTIQFQITDDLTNYGWWMEASATWMEDRVYPEVDDYVYYLGYWFAHPDLPLDYFDYSFEYGTSLWIKHMTEKYGSEFVFDVWDKIKTGDSALSAVDRSLTEKGTTLEEELKELRVADVTFTYDDSSIYKKWDTTNPISVPYTNTDFAQVSTVTVTYNNVKLDTLAAKYYSFSPPSGPGALKIAFNGDGNTRVMVIGLLGLRSAGYDATEILPDSADSGYITVDGFSSGGPYTEVVAIPLNYSTVDQGNFDLTATYTPALSDKIGSISIIPAANTSIVTGDAGVVGKQQYYIIQKDTTGKQILESGTTWASDSSVISIDSNGLATASKAITGSVITASLGGFPANSPLSFSNPITMTPGMPRDCNVNSSGNGSSNKRCFIATAAFGSPFHPYVEILREFRDTYLLTNSPGRKIVSLYYLYSPPIAEQIARNAILRVIVQSCLIPAIIFSGIMVKTTILEKIGGVILLMVIVSIILKRIKQIHVT